jgi:hypothetical protein
VSDHFYIGGYPEQQPFRPVTGVRFEGCIDGVQIDGTPVDLSQNIGAVGVTPGCPVQVSTASRLNCAPLSSVSQSSILTPSSRVVLENRIVPQLFLKFPAFCGAHWLITFHRRLPLVPFLKQFNQVYALQSCF